jgi:hypothetical protein
MTSTELQKQLDAMKAEARKKEKEIRCQIAKQKRQEHAAHVKFVGDLFVKSFPNYTNEDFQRMVRMENDFQRRQAEKAAQAAQQQTVQPSRPY